MKNPLIARLPRELKSELGKYIVIFVFIAGMISIVSGFLVASGSMQKAYDESFEKYSIEDGNFTLMNKADESLFETLSQNGVALFENFYFEERTKEIDSTLRIFKIRDEINRACLMQGEMPDSDSEIAIDRLYAQNNSISVGDTLTVGGKSLEVTGLVALSDYSALFSSPSDMMFDAVLFGVAVMTESGFDSFDNSNISYCYSWRYGTSPENDDEAMKMSEELLSVLSQNAVLTEYIPQYSNQAIRFTGDDMGTDSAAITAFLYIVVVIIAFVFAITVSNTIAKESAVIGTLRASGYSRGELIAHYMTLPVLVTLTAAIVGNIVGYTVLKDIAADIVYASYCLPTYVTVWNADAFVKTTVIPVILMLAINFAELWRKLKISPLKFIRRDLSKSKNKKAVRLNTKIGILSRFRIRIILQNIPNYITIAVGIFLANFIMLFGLSFSPMLDKYKDDIISNIIARNQYVLKAPAETATEGAEKYCMTNLKTVSDKLNAETVSVMGIVKNSAYVDIEPDSDSVYISDAYAEKFRIEKGDTVRVKDEYNNIDYEFEVGGIYTYPAGISIFMSDEMFAETFGLERGYFNGYFSDKEITDIDKGYIAMHITEDDLTKTSRQMTLSLSGMIDMMSVFGIIVFMLLIYLLSKIIVEKNAQSISMAKILGYSDKEINSLYVMSTAIVVVLSLVLTLPVINALMSYIYRLMLSGFAGWLPYYAPFEVFVKIVAMGIVAYAVIAFAQTRRVKKIPLDIALKNRE